MRSTFIFAFLFIAGCASQPPLTPTSRVITGENIAPLLTSAKLERIENHGQLSGLKVKDIEAGSNWERAGFHNGDQVTAINGKPVQTGDDLFHLLEVMVRPEISEIQVVRAADPIAGEHVEVLRVRAAR